MRKTVKVAVLATGAALVLAAFPLRGKLIEIAAVRSAPRKEPRESRSALATEAVARFWQALGGGRYEEIDDVKRNLTAAYLQNPRDPDLALLTAHVHLWRAAESARLEVPDPGVTDDLVVAERYFEEAGLLSPGDGRITGWLGAVRLSLGEIHQNEALTRRGYFLLRDAVRRFPEFNHFALAYMLSRLPASDPRFREGLEEMWENDDVCWGRADRHAPAPPDPSRAVSSGPGRVCWNGPTTPHSVEGFFLNFGDMLVKANQPDVARKAYADARAMPSYASWSYRDVLERRIETADERAQAFARARNPREEPEILARSRYACSACHAR